MQFTYAHGIPTVEQAMAQAVGFFTQAGNPLVEGPMRGAIQEVADFALNEIRMIWTSELSTLLDPEGVALDFNEGVEKCIQLIEGAL